MSSLIAAFGPQRVLKIVDVGTVPREEEAGEMDLSGKMDQRMSPQIDARPRFARPTDLIRNTHQRIQIHMGINKV